MKPIRLTLVCSQSLQKQANQELVSMLGTPWENTFETFLENSKTGEKLLFAGWQGPEEQAEKVKAVCEALNIECYETLPEGVFIDTQKEEVLLDKRDTPMHGKKGLFLQEAVLKDLLPEAIK